MATFIPSKHKSTKKFFWAITSQTESFLSGYLRLIISLISYPESIKLLIAKFSCNMFIDSKILKFNEIDPFLSLLSNQWSNNKLHFELLHRGSDNKFDVKLLKTQIFDKYNEYIFLIESDRGNTFGIYNNFKTSSINNQYEFNHYGFEFVINSQTHYLPKLFPPRRSEAFYYRSGWGQFQGNFIFIRSKNCYIALPQQQVIYNDSLCIGHTGFNANQLCGGIDSTHFMNHQAFRFKVIEYEVYKIK